MKFLKEKAKNATKEIAICWQTGSLKHGTDIIFSCDYEAGKAYFEPLLELGITKDELSAAVERPSPPQAKRL